MTDAREPNQRPRPAPPLVEAGGKAPRPPLTSNGAASAPAGPVYNAARRAPVAAPPPPPKAVQDRVKDTAQDAVLNSFAVAKEGWEHFQKKNRFFKYKVGIIGAWLAMSALSFVVACPGDGVETQEFGARLVVAGDAAEPVYMIMNESAEPWRDVLVIVNGRYRAAVAQVPATENLTLTPRQLLSDKGAPAPKDLRVSTLELRTHLGTTQLEVQAP